jgi:hypothetical protein
VRLEAQFRTCLHDRLVASDPTVTPASCKPPAGVVLSPAVRGIVAGAGITAVRHDFAASLVRTLWFQVGVFVLAFLLMLAWPRGAGRRVTAHADGGVAAERQSGEVTAAVAAGPGVSAAASNGQVT